MFNIEVAILYLDKTWKNEWVVVKEGFLEDAEDEAIETARKRHMSAKHICILDIQEVPQTLPKAILKVDDEGQWFGFGERTYRLTDRLVCLRANQSGSIVYIGKTGFTLMFDNGGGKMVGFMYGGFEEDFKPIP